MMSASAKGAALNASLGHRPDNWIVDVSALKSAIQQGWRCL